MQTSYCPALTSLVCFCLRIGFLEGETAAIVQASIESCHKDLGVLSIGRASHIAFARGLYLALKQFSSTAFELCTRIGLNFYRLANECNGRIFMHFLPDAALVEVLHTACTDDKAGKSEAFLYKFTPNNNTAFCIKHLLLRRYKFTLALLKFANRRGQLLTSTDNDSFFKHLSVYGRSLTSRDVVDEIIRKAKSVRQEHFAINRTPLQPHTVFRLYRRTLADYRSDRRDLPLGEDVLPQPMDVVWLPCLDMSLPKQGDTSASSSFFNSIAVW